MKIFCITINDSSPISNHLLVSLNDILNCIKDGDSFMWSILYADFIGKDLFKFNNLADESDKGIVITWKELLDISAKAEQTIDLVLIGCKDQINIKKYGCSKEKKNEMYENCDYIIKNIDGGFWEIFTKNESKLEEFTHKFKDFVVTSFVI